MLEAEPGAAIASISQRLTPFQIRIRPRPAISMDSILVPLWIPFCRSCYRIPDYWSSFPTPSMITFSAASVVAETVIS